MTESIQIGHLLRQCFDRLRGIAIRPDTKRILPVNFEQVCGFIQDVGDGLVIHE